MIAFPLANSTRWSATQSDAFPPCRLAGADEVKITDKGIYWLNKWGKKIVKQKVKA